jgi:hypothetical protein
LNEKTALEFLNLEFVFQRLSELNNIVASIDIEVGNRQFPFKAKVVGVQMA